MNRVLLFVVSVMLSSAAMAQVKAVRVESPIVTEKDFVWYVEQKEAWKAQTQKNPKDETAWLNYYHAAHYMGWWGANSDSVVRQVMSEMKQAIPDSYTYNFCAYRAGHLADETDGDKYAEAALAKLPDEMQFFDYDQWVCYLAMKGYEPRMAQMAKRYFDSGFYSENVLRYGYNELAGMDADGIYIGSGDTSIIPKWLIQEGMGKHKDKTIVCIPFLAVKEYRQWLNGKLNISLPEWEAGSYDTYQDFERAALQTIIDKYGSKVYFSATTPPSSMEPWKQNLYNEGLLLKYSKKSYDNLAVKRRNVEERYMLEYLLVSFRPDWTSGQRLSANYAVLLADLLPYYEKHDQKRYDWLMRRLVSGISNTSLSEEKKQEYMNVLIEK
ncbi:MAG: hypothetical protein J5770_03605 [Bacteroidaceae bacterium]|nr:hypothetical protein [Bacteroidaceae bacterium]